MNALARHVSSPYTHHLIAVKHVLRYLQDKQDYKLIFSPETESKSETPLNIEIYTDSDWGHEKDNRKSIGGWISMLNGRPIACQSKKQSTIAVSSTESEYYALGEAVREALFMRQWFQHYLDQTLSINILCDNQGAIHMADHSTNHNRTKHIDIQHHFLREHIQSKSVIVSYISTADQLADLLTKPTSTAVFTKLRDQLLN